MLETRLKQGNGGLRRDVGTPHCHMCLCRRFCEKSSMICTALVNIKGPKQLLLLVATYYFKTVYDPTPFSCCETKLSILDIKYM